MELPTLTPDAPAQPAPKTEVGSYFVANYPPFSVWSQNHLPAIQQALDAKPDPDTKLGLYLHIPFCRKRCKFCYFRVYTDKNANDIETYLSALSREIDLYADRPGLQGRQFEFVYFGGGTPSYLSNAQLERLIERINVRWNWDAAKEVTFECEPGTLKESKLETIKKIGVTRLSLGVEHFDDEILSVNGRAHKSPEILRAWEWIRNVGFPQVNIDLIAGMLGETEDKWKACVEKAIALDADSVTIYQMEVPYNTGIAKDARDHGGVSEVASWAQKRAWVDYAFKQFEAAGYVVSSGYTLVKPSRHAGFVYRDSLWRGADLVATGVASFGHFQGVHYQNLDKWETYIDSIERGELPINRALPVNDHQRLIREMILLLKTGSLDAAYFRRKFGQDILKVFDEGFKSLVEEGWATVTGDQVLLNRKGLLQVDTLLPRFFEPEHRGIRYT
ncbi:coproporphyrinogen-III oxidase family protein [Humisphaera borealis]|uniref:Coproporphyrinogen III oxidase family protein n=1 Tax=Humisphaera borealis TaxID=2807512 RepID=A0A7M2X314_9BACT|nr:coproporphyrinogen-III oxidase family protein [Humisphaera borealis]QOV91150.1 coproporphyrinogen III oxidase family protein [Humisphaera borealis]